MKNTDEKCLYYNPVNEKTGERWKAEQVTTTAVRAAEARLKVLTKYASTIENAAKERDGFLWFLDRGYSTENVIFYNHTGRFCVGWRSNGFDATAAEVWEATLCDFPFPHDVKRAPEVGK